MGLSAVGAIHHLGFAIIIKPVGGFLLRAIHHLHLAIIGIVMEFDVIYKLHVTNVSLQILAVYLKIGSNWFETVWQGSITSEEDISVKHL